MGRGKRERQRTGKTKKSDFEEEENAMTPSKSKSRFVFSDSDDDAVGNEDLSLQIVEKAMSRASSVAGRGREGGVEVRRSEVGGDDEDIVMTELVALDSSKKSKMEKKEKKDKKKKKDKKIETEAQTVNVVPEGQDTETIEGLEVVKLSEQDDVDDSDNAVLRRLLRGPRYFDPADSSWGTCYNCGEEGHVALNCKAAKRKKPCFVCGSFEHGAKECQKGKDCFICNKSGHRAKDCPKKFKKCSQGSDLCLKCGSSGHVMSSCNNDYSLDDLKEIQCYVCKNFGHLSCANYFGTVPSEVSCYKCGQLGHTGLACRRDHREKVGEATPSSCFKCGIEGHFARECSSSVKVKKRSHDMSTPKWKSSKEDTYKGYKSAPQEVGKAHKKKKLQFDEENTASPSKWKRWGGWIMDDQEDFPRGKGKASRGWDSYSTPNDKSYHYRASGRHALTPSRSPKRFDSPYSRTPNSHSSRNSVQHGYSASRFGYPSNGESRINYDRWY